MKLARCINNGVFMFDQHIPLGAWYGVDDDGEAFFCTVHGKSEDGSLQLYRFNGRRWIKGLENNKTTHRICAWATKHNLWWTKCKWFTDEDRQFKQEMARDEYLSGFSRMMEHPRKHKPTTQGITLERDYYLASRVGL